MSRDYFRHLLKYLFWYLLVFYGSFSVKCFKFIPKWPVYFFQPILTTIFVTKATVKIKLIPDFHTWAIVLIN